MKNMFLTSLVVAVAILSVPSNAQESDQEPFRGNQGLEPVLLEDLGSNPDVDLRASVFNVSISRNTRPRNGYDCERVDDPINRYPFAIEGAKGAKVYG